MRNENAGLWEYAAGDVAGAVGVEAAKMAALGAVGEAAGRGSMIGRAAKATLEIQAIVDKVDTAIAIVDAGEAAWDGDWEQAQDLVVQAAFSYAMSRMMGAAADAIQCLDGETLVATPNGLVKIEDLTVGDRVSTDLATDGLAAGFEETKAEEPVIDPATWRVFVVELSGAEGSDRNANRSGILELLKPADWYAASFAGNDRIGNAWVWLEVEEWGVKGAAKLLAIKPCPKLRPGPGRLVTMRSVTSYSGPMASVQFKDAAGQTDTITGTDGHPVYSIDRCGYVDLGSLEPGERVRTADGWATAESMARWWGKEVVHNLEVDGVHRYAVGQVGVAGHNAKAAGGGGCMPRRGNGGRGGGKSHARVQQDLHNRVGGSQERSIDGSGRVVDLEDAQGRLHQIGDMRSRNGYRPSARERGAIEDLRRVAPDRTIIFHDKLGKLPSLINPDLQAGWRPAPSRYRKTL
ncbi:MAG: hypothetical protein NTV94_13495 [Planctomycetota bacterium]|nr:hypothetical protein [Planctomycetota bacterium]